MLVVILVIMVMKQTLEILIFYLHCNAISALVNSKD